MITYIQYIQDLDKEIEEKSKFKDGDYTRLPKSELLGAKKAKDLILDDVVKEIEGMIFTEGTLVVEQQKMFPHVPKKQILINKEELLSRLEKLRREK